MGSKRRFVVAEGQDFTLLFRVVDLDGVVLVPADVASYQVHIFKLGPEGLEHVYRFESSTSSEIVQASLQTGKGWDQDGVGWNVAVPITPTSLGPHKLKGGTVYDIEVYLTAASLPTNDVTGLIPLDVARVEIQARHFVK